MKVLNNISQIYSNKFQYNNQKPQTVHSKNSYESVSFTNSKYGILSEQAQKQISNIYTSLDFVKNFFSLLKTNPTQATKIRRNFQNLVETKTNSLTFKTDDNCSLIISRGRNNQDLLRISVREDEVTKHFIIYGSNRVIKNTNQNKPSNIPVKIKYMTDSEIADSQVEHYITLACNNLYKYAKYLKNSTAKLPKIKFPVKFDLSGLYDDTIKEAVKFINDLFLKKPEELPSHLIPKINAATGRIAALSVKTSDGGELRFSKRLNPKYKDSLRYLAFEKINPDGTPAYMSIDLSTYQFLKMKEKGKPMITYNSVHEYSIEEVHNRNLVEKLEEYMKEIKGKEPEVPNKHPQKPAKTEPVKVNSDSNSNTDIVKQAEDKAVSDAKLFSDTYFRTFFEQIKQNLKTQIETFNLQIDDIVKGILKQ